MNYQKIYDSLIAKRQQNLAIKTGPHTVAKHHILPRSMGGSDDKSNLVVLTNKEHFVAHHLLWKIYQNDEMTNAFMLMSTTMEYKISARTYALLVEQFGSIQSMRMKGNTIWVGRKHKKETIEKMKQSAKKFDHHRLVKESTKLKISQKLKGKKLSSEHLEKMRIANLGSKNHMFGKRMVHNILTNENLKIDKDAPLPEGYAEHRAFFRRKNITKPRSDKGKKRSPLSKETREKISISRHGKKLSDKHKQNIRNSAKRPEKWIKNLSTRYKDIDFIGFEVEKYMKMNKNQRHNYLINWIKTHSKNDIL